MQDLSGREAERNGRGSTDVIYDSLGWQHRPDWIATPSRYPRRRLFDSPSYVVTLFVLFCFQGTCYESENKISRFCVSRFPFSLMLADNGLDTNSTSNER